MLTLLLVSTARSGAVSLLRRRPADRHRAGPAGPHAERPVTLWLASFSGRFNLGRKDGGVSAPGQFGVGALLGVVWLPCVGPTLGAAIALASLGQSMGMACIVMLAYGIGAAGVLLLAGLMSGRLLARSPGALMSGAGFDKRVLGWSLLLLGVLVLSGMDKYLEALAVDIVPQRVFSL